MSTMSEHSRLPGWRVHLCTWAQKQDDDAAQVRDWLQSHGCTVLATRADRIEPKLVAARECDLCLLLLDKEFTQRDADSSFSHTELEVSAAADINPAKIVVFARGSVESSTIAGQRESPEQREFVQRMESFMAGAFRRMYQTQDELRVALDDTLLMWVPPGPLRSVQPLPVSSNAVMISSTGDLPDQRRTVRAAIEEMGFSVIDYVNEPSEPVTPVDRVVSWARNCQALVLILDSRYGYISPLDGLGVTELEFVTALQAQRPIVVFIGPNAYKTKDIDQRQFLERVRRLVPVERIFSFTQPKDEVFRDQLLSHRALLEMTSEQRPIAQVIAQVDDEDRLRWYKRQVQRWLGTVPHPARSQGMLLEQIYFSLSLTPFYPHDDSPQENGALENGALENETQLDVESAIQQLPRLVLQGDPGMGKSVALRWLAITAQKDVVPVYIRLGLYARAYERGAATSLEDYLCQEERRLGLGADGEPSLWMTLLRTGQGIVLLDGLDEVSSHAPASISGAPAETPRETTVRAILTLSAQLPMSTPIVVATRVLDRSAERLASTFTALRVQPLTSTQQRQLILQWQYTTYPDDPLRAVNTVQRTLDVLQSQQHLQAWATSPLMLTLFTTLVDTSDDKTGAGFLSKAVVLRRAMRLLLGQWGTAATRADDNQSGKRRFGSRHLWAKEQFLLTLAWSAFQAGRRSQIDMEDVQATYQSLPQLARDMCDANEMIAELSGEEGFLLQVGEGEYVFYHPTFQEYLSAGQIAAMEVDDCSALIARKRLDAGWDETTQLLIGELDRLERQDVADKLIQTLIEADGRPLSSVAWTDPTHLALRRATRVQGTREPANAKREVAILLANTWEDLLQRGLAADPPEKPLLEMASQAFLDMGPAAAGAGLLLRQRVSYHVRHPDLSAFLIPLGIIEALGNCGTPEDAALLASLLERGQGIGESQAAALRGLNRLSPDAVRPYRMLLPRFVFAGGSSIRSSLAGSGEFAAALLIQLEPSKGELEGIHRLGGRWSQEALLAAPLLPLSDAITMLDRALNTQSVVNNTHMRSAFDYHDDTEADNRFAALTACIRLRKEMLPILTDILYRSIFDTPRNFGLAERVVRLLGAAAVPGTVSFIEQHCRNEILREQYFGDVLAGLTSARDHEQIQALLSQAIEVLRKIKHIQDDEYNDERVAWAARQQKPLATVSFDVLLETLRTARTKSDALARDAVIVQTLNSLASIGPSAAPALEDIRAMARDRRYRSSAIAALAGLGAVAAPALPILQQALADEDVHVQAQAIAAIGQLGDAAASALPQLRSVLSSTSKPNSGQSEVRQQAIVAWGRLWPLTRPLLPVIIEVLRSDQDTAVRLGAIDILGQYVDSNPTALDMLHSLAQPSNAYFAWNGDVASHARAALERILARTEDAVKTLGGQFTATNSAELDREQRGLLKRRRGWLSRLRGVRNGE